MTGDGEHRSTTSLADAAGVRAASGRQLDLRRSLPPEPAERRYDHKLAVADADGARQLRSLLRHQPERRGRRHECADRRPPLHARHVVGRGESHDRRQLSLQRGAPRVSHGSWSRCGRRDLSTTCTRGDRCRSRSASRGSPTSPATSSSSPTRSVSRRTTCASAAAWFSRPGSEPGSHARHLHVPRDDDGAVR